MENWKEFLNKNIKLIYDDGSSHPSKKVGLLIGFTETHLILKINSHKEAILLSKILRVEEDG
jgi:hypothetical protein